ESSLRKQLLVQIDGSCVLQNQLMCLLNEKEWINDDLRRVQFHLDLLKSQNLVKDNWKDIDLTEWKITEQLQKAIQKDSSSCGLFMVKFMEYFTECALSYPIT
uniref:Ubiquitin-like protease family profile domain-containing protein n=2 Tax=Aegilops tauschii subsp. strangulata TaxID=200361 RepID=A0A453SP49_AEGTS